MIKEINKSAEEIYQLFGKNAAITELCGNKNAKALKMAGYEHCTKDDLVAVPDEKPLRKAVENGVAVLVIPDKLKKLALEIAGECGILISGYVPLSHALLKQFLFDFDEHDNGWPRVHPSAIIHPSVKIPDNVRIGPGAVIEKDVVIGENSIIMSKCVIERNAEVGKYCILHHGSTISRGCIIGDKVIIHANAVIGGEGFGFSQDQNFNHYRIPQTGIVRIGDKVRIGANTTIDRAAYGETSIGEGCIIDNLCHIAHNVEMGKNCIIMAGFLCAGSVKIGNRVVASGGAVIKDHVKICDGAYLMHRAGVIKDITEPGMYAGAPVLPMKQYVMSQANYAKLGDLYSEIKDIKRKLEAI